MSVVAFKNLLLIVLVPFLLCAGVFLFGMYFGGMVAANKCAEVCWNKCIESVDASIQRVLDKKHGEEK